MIAPIIAYPDTPASPNFHQPSPVGSRMTSTSPDAKTAELACLYMQSVLTSVATAEPPTSRENILRLNWVDFAEVGLSHSKQLDDFVSLIVNGIAHHPKTTATVVFPPSTPQEGYGLTGKESQRKKLTEKAVANMEEKLKEKSAVLNITKVNIVLSEEDCYSKSRDLTAFFYLIMTNDKGTAVTGAQEHSSADDVDNMCHFTQSFVFNRRAIPQLVPTHPRKAFKDWSKSLAANSDTKVGDAVVHKHFFTGREFLKPVMLHIFRTMNLGKHVRCHVRHFTMYSPELGMACMELNSESHSKMPFLAYTGVTWQEGAKNVAKNVDKALVDRLTSLNQSNAYPIRGAPAHSGQGDAMASGRAGRKTRPTQDPGEYKHTHPKANGDLPLRDTVLTDMRQRYHDKATLLKELDAGVQQFNEKFNKSGQTYKEEAKRTAADADLDDGIKPEALGAQEHSKEDIPGAISVPHENGEFELIFNEAGDAIFLYALKDGIIDPTMDMGAIQGNFKLGNPATSLMSSASQWIEWGMKDVNVKVCARALQGDGSSKPTPKTDIMTPPAAQEPQPLVDFLKFLTVRHRKVRMELVTHKLTCTAAGEWTINPEQAACLQVVTDAEQRKTSNYKLDNIAGLIDLKLTREKLEGGKIGLFHSLIYWDKINRIMSDYPCFRPLGKFSFKQGQLYKLWGK